MLSDFLVQKGYSKLYLDLSEVNPEPNDDRFVHPFECFSIWLNQDELEPKKEGFEQSLSYLKVLKQSLNYAYDCFQIELTQLQDHKSEYLNNIIDFLFEDYLIAMSKDEILASTIRQAFKKICESQWNVFINNKNRKKLTKWHKLKDPIKSFVLKKKIDTQTFENITYNRMSEDFFLIECPYPTFKALFEGKYLENKVDWLNNKSSLVYFIKSLINSNILQNPKNKHWEIVSEFFLLQGEQIEQSELLNQKSPKDKQLIQNINRIIRELKMRYS